MHYDSELYAIWYSLVHNYSAAYSTLSITVAALTSTVGSWVRIPLEAWISVLGSGLATGWSLVQGVLPNVLD
jgi:hypothetical protein